MFFLLHEYVNKERYVICYKKENSFTDLLISMGKIYKGPSCAVRERGKHRDSKQALAYFS